MDNLNNINDEPVIKSYNEGKKEVQLLDFLKKRIEILKDTKKDILNGINFEEIMKDADREYQPRDLRKAQDKNTILVQDEETGLRGTSKFVTLPDSDDWRSTISEPTLLVKLQTALSVLIDQNPEAVFKATNEKYEKRNNIAKSLWKRNWEINDSIEVLKLFVFDLAKYGFAVGHTLPRILKREKEILDVVDTKNPSNNKYKKIQITEFNDIYREKLDLYRTWIDDKANLSDKYSINDWYYEKDYSYEDFMEEFGVYSNSKSVKYGQLPLNNDGINSATKSRGDMITVGFYENKKKDLYCIYIPEQNIILYYSPLPNDDGKLTLWYAYWLERDPRTIYGIGLYELVKNNKVLYDRLKNMTIDQLVMAIYPMLFYTGVPMNGENEISISPNKLVQKQAGTNIEQVKVEYDPRGWDGVTHLTEDIDNITGISPTLQGDVTGKTLGEVLHAKDSALKRLNIPLLNIAKAIEQDAYITLSWANQVYSIPEIKEFVSAEKLAEYEEEMGAKASSVLMSDNKVEGEFYPKIDLGLTEDRDGTLIESPERRFFQLGNNDGNLPLESIKWEGKISIKAKSIISPNPELERQRKLELYNIVSPVVAQMAALFYQHIDPTTQETYTPQGGMETAVALYKPLKQILEIQDEKSENWIPDDILQLAENPDLLKEAQAQNLAAEEAKPENSLFIPQEELNAENGQSVASQLTPAAASNTVVPKSSIANPLRKVMGSMKGVATKAISSLK